MEEVNAFVLADMGNFNLDVVYLAIKPGLSLLVVVMIAYLVVFLGIKAFITVLS